MTNDRHKAYNDMAMRIVSVIGSKMAQAHVDEKFPGAFEKDRNSVHEKYQEGKRTSSFSEAEYNAQVDFVQHVLWELRLVESDIRMAEERESLKRYRGRRLKACHAADELCSVIENLGKDETESPFVDESKSAPINDAIKNELKNSVANTLRMILIFNDGHLSPQTLKSF